MSSRCLACNKVMSFVELCTKRSDGEYEDLCRHCKEEAGVFYIIEERGEEA